jgi:hypothetical protein
MSEMLTTSDPASAFSIFQAPFESGRTNDFEAVAAAK